MRFFTPILAISAAALSTATTTKTTTTTSGLIITSLQFYEPLEPTPDDNISINFNVEAGEVTDTCAIDWKYGTDGGKSGYPTSFTACANGAFSFLFESYSSLSEWSVEVKYTYTSGAEAKTVLGERSVTAAYLSCGPYQGSFNRCELANKYSVNGLSLKTPKTT
ncbi:hypothetical protein BC567DRAFT_215499 [Phyllosticta citribraziliensis]